MMPGPLHDQSPDRAVLNAGAHPTYGARWTETPLRPCAITATHGKGAAAGSRLSPRRTTSNWGAVMSSWAQTSYLFLADGRVFIRGASETREADQLERVAAAFLMFEGTAGPDP